MSKPLRVAGEVDSYCTKCRLILNHRIVSMNGPKPHHVLCLTCHTQHLYRPNAPGERAASSGGNGGSRAAGSANPRPPTRAAQARIDREHTWEKAVAGRAVGDFKPYSVTATFELGDLIRHKKFGDGLVTRVIDSGKVEVLFRDEPRTLAHGMSS